MGARWVRCSSTAAATTATTINKWTERPSALSDGNNQYATKGIDDLLRHYEQDNRSVGSDPCTLGLHLPLLHTDENSTRTVRVCQWNLNNLCHGTQWTNGCRTDLANTMARVLLETNAHVLVLHEYGGSSGDHEDPRDPLRLLHEALQAAGYAIHVADVCFPTAVAVRLPVVITCRCVVLDDGHSRAAVGVTVSLPTQKKLLTVYGTHLEDSDACLGRFRRQGMEALLQHINMDDSQNSDAVVIVGDLNQQRERDYTPQEWQAICANKSRRDSPPDDGVAALLETSGYRCSYDTIDESETDLNWNPSDPPPSTHWTGTIVDYFYTKTCTDNTSLTVKGIYVSPCSLSDHRIIVTDFGIQ